MKIRYTRQHDRFRCGPTAVANVIKWSGKPFSYKSSIKQLDKLCKCQHGNGTYPKDLDVALSKIAKKNKLTLFKKERPSLREIEKHLKEGGTLLFRYYWGPRNGHYFLVTRQSKARQFYTVNFEREKTYRWVPRSVFIKDVLTYRRNKLTVWFISKK
jgi:hypothetical protein